MKRRVVIYSPEAADDIDWIYNTVARAGSAATADHYDERIRAFCKQLEYTSERGSRRDDIRPGLRVVGFAHRITIAFTVEPERVLILRIFYGGANWQEALS